MIENPDEIKVMFLTVMLCKPPHCNEKCNCAAMACKSAFPRLEYLPEMLGCQIVVRLIEQTMTKTRTDDRSDKQSIKKRIKQLLAYAFSLEEPLEDEPSEDESRNEQKGVPPEREESQRNDLRIDIPIYS